MTRIHAALAAIALVLVGFLGGYLVHGSLSDKVAEPNAVDVGFAQDMSVHHLQAVELSGYIIDTTDLKVRSLAWDILTAQQNEIGTMRAWLTDWGKPLQAEKPMTWMTSGSSHHHTGDAAGTHSESNTGLMPGMATPAEIAGLRGASGPARDVQFLQLMLRHHQGGAPMADEATKDAGTAKVRAIANRMLKTQGAEMDLMRAMLTERGAQPLAFG